MNGIGRIFHFSWSVWLDLESARRHNSGSFWEIFSELFHQGEILPWILSKLWINGTELAHWGWWSCNYSSAALSLADTDLHGVSSRAEWKGDKESTLISASWLQTQCLACLKRSLPSLPVMMNYTHSQARGQNKPFFPFICLCWYFARIIRKITNTMADAYTSKYLLKFKQSPLETVVCEEQMKSCVNVCCWQEHSHIKSPSDSHPQEWQSLLPQAGLKRIAKPFSTSNTDATKDWPLSNPVSAETISHSFLSPDVCSLKLLPYKDLLLKLADLPPPSSAAYSK